MTTRDHSDPLDELFNSPMGSRPMARPALAPIAKPTFVEACRKCSGTGQWRPGYPCFACKGNGRNEFKTSAVAREKAKAGAAQRKEAKRATSWTEFKAAHQAEAEWIVANPRFPFAVSMREAVEKFGDLTPGQLGAVQKCLAREIERARTKEATVAQAPTVDVSRIEAAFAVARQGAAADREGLKWLRLRLDTFVFSDAPANGRWAAAIFVKEGVTKLGRISGGKLICAPDTSAETKARILAALADPAAAAKAYGQRTGECSICGRTLTNADSRKLGIGPICAERFGF